MQTFDFRKLTLDHLRELVSWAETEGWMPIYFTWPIPMGFMAILKKRNSLEADR